MRLSSPYLKLSLLVTALFFSGGCANQAMNWTIDSWQNQPISEAVAKWGQPSEELKVSGKHLFVWNTYDGVLAPPTDPKFPARPDSEYCMRLLGVDRSGKVISGAWEGSGCPGLFSGWRRW